MSGVKDDFLRLDLVLLFRATDDDRDGAVDPSTIDDSVTVSPPNGVCSPNEAYTEDPSIGPVCINDGDIDIDITSSDSVVNDFSDVVTSDRIGISSASSVVRTDPDSN